MYCFIFCYFLQGLFVKKCVNVKLYLNVFWFYDEWLTCIVEDITESF